MDQVVRRSIARVHFKWRNNHNEVTDLTGKEMDMVIPGIIISVEDGDCLMFVDPSFCRLKKRFSFDVNLPNGDGTYGESIRITTQKDHYIMYQEFYVFTVKAGKNKYVEAAKFETSPLKQFDIVHTFSFAREVAISTACSTGHIVALSKSQIDAEIAFHDCAMHEYGHFGSPIFNKNGHVLGICYATQSRTHAWTVDFLKTQFDELLEPKWSVTYRCSKGDPSQEGVLIPSSSSSVPCAVAPAALPSGVVTLGYMAHESPRMIYFTGIVIFCERGQENEYTTFVLSPSKAVHDTTYVYFEPNERTEAEICAINDSHVMLRIKDESFHEPITWSSNTHPLRRYELVKSVSIMAGTKINVEAAAPIESLIGILGSYSGEITTPRCHAATASSCTILAGTEKYFQFSCSYQDDLINFKNIDSDRDTYGCDSMISAPVFSLKGDFVGVIVSCGNWTDTKTGMYSEWLLPIVVNLMKDSYTGWSKDMLKWSSAQSV